MSDKACIVDKSINALNYAAALEIAYATSAREMVSKLNFSTVGLSGKYESELELRTVAAKWCSAL